MKKKAYMAPATEIFTINFQHILAGSEKVTLGQESTGNVITEKGEENEMPQEADSRRSKWDDDDNYDE